jgi:uncharacterized protein (TIGR02001 family)
MFVTLLALSGTASADWSANLGYASEYHFRGIFQKNSSASGGIDFEAGGFYAGTWAADVGDGLEVDLYGGFGFDIGESVSLSIGATGYYYTGDFDDTYQEINLGAGFGFVSLEAAIGQYDNFDGPTLDYTYYAITLEHNGLYGKFGGFSQDFEGEYFEFGYGTTVSDIDLGVSLIFANEDLVGDDEESIVFTIGKSFDL